MANLLYFCCIQSKLQVVKFKTQSKMHESQIEGLAKRPLTATVNNQAGL